MEVKITEKDKEKTTELFLHDKSFGRYILGIDEVGRGPMYGDVVVCGVIIDTTKEPIYGVKDSKKLTPKKRDFLYEQILESKMPMFLAIKNADEIDRVNILNATKVCTNDILLKALEYEKENGICIDGIFLDAIDFKEFNIPDEIVPKIHSFPKADDTSYACACASVCAKVLRDRDLDQKDLEYPQYGFANHKGYGTKQHLDAIQEYGALKDHRTSYLFNLDVKNMKEHNVSAVDVNNENWCKYSMQALKQRNLPSKEITEFQLERIMQLKKKV